MSSSEQSVNPFPPVTMDHPDIQAHLARQASVPEGFVKMDDSTIKPLGGSGGDNKA